MPLDQLGGDGLQRDPVQWITGMGGTHELMEYGCWPHVKSEWRIAYSTNEELLVYISWQECEGIAWFIWLNETIQMNQISQENHE